MNNVAYFMNLTDGQIAWEDRREQDRGLRGDEKFCTAMRTALENGKEQLPTMTDYRQDGNRTIVRSDPFTLYGWPSNMGK